MYKQEQFVVERPRLSLLSKSVALLVAALGLPALLGYLIHLHTTPFELFSIPLLSATCAITLWMAIHWRDWRSLPISLICTTLLAHAFINILVRHGDIIETAEISMLKDMLVWASLPTGLAAVALFWRIFENQAIFKRTQEALHATERQYRHFIENANDAVLTADVEGHILLVNPGTARLFGKRRADLLNAEYFELIPDEAVQAIKDTLVRQQKGKSKAFYHEFTITARGGTTSWIGQTVQAVMEAGKLTGFQAMLRDVTERREAEEALRQSEARLRTLFDTMSEGVLQTGPHGRIVFANPAAEMLLGVGQGNLKTDTLKRVDWTFLREDGTEMPLSEWAGIRAHTEQRSIQNVITGLRRKDGKKLWLNVSAVPMLGGGGNAEGVVVTLNDISQKKESDEDIRIIEFALDNTLDHVFLLAREGHIIYANKHARASLGYTAAGLAEKRIFDIDTGLAHEDWSETWRRAKAGEWPTFESEHIRKDGQTFPTATSASYFEYQGRGYIFAFVHDISRETDLAAQLRQSQKMEAIGTLAGGIAHDFNNVLTAILGYTDLAMDELPKDNLVRGWLSQVYTAAQRAAAMVRQILTFSRRNEERQHPLLLSPIVKEALKLLRGSLPPTIDIVEHVTASLNPVMADPTQLQQIVMNLCTNAYHAMRDEGGTLDVTLEELNVGAEKAAHHLDLRPGPYARLVVHDTGTGMDAATQKRMFEPFFTTKLEGEGTGLGLATVHGIVKSHKGAITVESAPGKGTCIEVYLPLTIAEATSEEPDQHRDRSALEGQERLLFVDDEEQILDSLGIALRNLGYKVTLYAAPAEALAYFKEHAHDFDVAITDQMMPGMRGSELAAAIHGVRAELPIILCTGFADSVAEDTARAHGVRAFLKKPMTARELAAAIRAACG